MSAHFALSGSQLIALVVAVVACVTDIRTRRIPNVVTFGAALGGLMYHLVAGGSSALSWAAWGWVVGLLLYLPWFLLRGMGAGDVKLIAALGAWIGPRQVAWVALFAAIAGGALAIVLALRRNELRRVFSNIYVLLVFWRVRGIRPLPELTLERPGAPRLAYAVPILAGLAVTLWLK